MSDILTKPVKSKGKSRVKKFREQEEIYEEPKKLSKFGEWMKAHPNGIEGMIVDMRAVMK
jgi:hypothetical protein